MQARTAILCTAILSLSLLLLSLRLHWPTIAIHVPIQDVANVLAPLLLTAAFIERAVEVVITPFRDGGASSLRKQIAVLQATQPVDSASIAKLQQQLDDYTTQTQKYAFCVLALLGLSAAIVGVRGLGLFLVQTSPPQPPGWIGHQQDAFQFFDIILSTLLLAGGANGLHAPISALTSFFNNSADQSKKTDAPPPS
jgi:hypothetical protein